MNSRRPANNQQCVTLPDCHRNPGTPIVTIAYIGNAEPACRYRHAAADLNIEMLVITPDSMWPAGATTETANSFNAIDAIDALAARCAVITVGYGCDERTYANVVKAGPKLRPNPSTIRLAHDPLAARYLLQDSGYGVADFEEIDSGDTWAVTRFARQHGWPIRMSTARWGTIRPQIHLVRPYSELDQMWTDSGELWLLEACEPLAPQVTVIIARRPSGHYMTYPVIASTQADFLAHRQLPITQSITDRAITTAKSIVDWLDTTGIATVKFVYHRDGRLLVDDFTYSPEGQLLAGGRASNSLYAAHLRAILDLPLEPIPIPTRTIAAS